MRVASERILTRLVGAGPGAMLRAGCVALFVCVSGCGGGDDDAPPPSSMPVAAPTPAPNPTPPTPAPGSTQPLPAPISLIVGTALSIDSGASGNPVSLRVARSTNGDGFAVWQADDGTRHNLWANRYRAATSAWGSPVNIEASDFDIDTFDLAVDAGGNATVVWNEPAPLGGSSAVVSARFEAGAGTWAAPVLLQNSVVPQSTCGCCW